MGADAWFVPDSDNFTESYPTSATKVQNTDWSLEMGLLVEGTLSTKILKSLKPEIRPNNIYSLCYHLSLYYDRVVK